MEIPGAHCPTSLYSVRESVSKDKLGGQMKKTPKSISGFSKHAYTCTYIHMYMFTHMKFFSSHNIVSTLTFTLNEFITTAAL